MAGFEFYQDESEKKEWRWRARASNGQITGASSEGYSSRQGAENNLRSIANMAVESNIRIAAEEDPAEERKFPVRFYKDASSDWRWQVWASNGQQVGASEEGFSSKDAARKNLENLIESIKAWDSSE